MLTVFFLAFGITKAQNNIRPLEGFEKVNIGSYIQATLIESETTGVSILETNLPEDQLVIKVDGKTLKVYLKNARNLQKDKVNLLPSDKLKVRIKIFYTALNNLTVKGSEDITFKSDLSCPELYVSGQGNGAILFNHVNIDRLRMRLYGNFNVSSKGGKIAYQHFRMYGNAGVDFENVISKETHLVMYGNNEIFVNVTNFLKTKGFGNFSVDYKGNPKLEKGLKLGKGTLRKVK